MNLFKKTIEFSDEDWEYLTGPECSPEDFTVRLKDLLGADVTDEERHQATLGQIKLIADTHQVADSVLEAAYRCAGLD